MSSSTLSLSPSEARRLSISAQQLAGPQPTPSKKNLLQTLKTIRCLQLDPIRAVERTQFLVLWSRLGSYKRSWLQELMTEGKIFEFWAHAASIVLTDDFPLHDYFMNQYATSPRSTWGKRVHQWVLDNESFRQYVLEEIQSRGPLLTGEIDDQSKVPWASGGWSSGRSVAYMLDYLWTTGAITVARRDGLKRWWDLTERVLPLEQLDSGWSSEAVTADGAAKSLRALGVGRLRDIKRHFIEKRYPGLPAAIRAHVQDGLFRPVTIDGWPDEWYVHADHLPLIKKIKKGDWHGRTTLLSPFDNLIRDRDRTELMWDFFYRIEIYVPKKKREFGYYVLPVLHHDRLIGRINPKMDYKKRLLSVYDVYAEAEAPQSRETAAAIGRAVDDLALFLGAKRVEYGNRPSFWADELISHDLTA